MDKIKKIIIILGILITILIFVAILILNANKPNIDNKEDENDGIGLTQEEDNNFLSKSHNTLSKVSSKNTYYSIENVVNKYYNTIKDYYKEFTYSQLEGKIKVSSEEKEEYFNDLKQMYSNKNNILDAQLIEKINIFKDSQHFLIDKMYMYKFDEQNIMYPVECYVVNSDKSLTHILLYIQVDLKNNSYYITQQEYNDNIENKIKDVKVDKVEKTSSNTIRFLSISDDEWIVKCFNDFKQKLTSSPEYFYNKLNEDYKNRRFRSIDNFKNYVRDNYNDIYSSKISKYKINKDTNYTQYIYIDQYGGYYILQETSPLDYTMFLDSYTIEIPESIKKYDNSKDKEKVELNIGKFIEALNTNDYKYIYNHLDEEFRNNNYKSLEQFENYCKSSFYEKNSINLNSYEAQGDIYMYNVVLTNLKDKSQNKLLKIVLKLEENREYVMSFSM